MTEPSNEGRVDVAVIGTGNIGTDLMIKILRTSKDLNLAAVAGIDPNSDGLRRADNLGVPTTFNGVDGLIGMEAFSDVQIVFDATSARAHAYHAEVLARSGRRLVDGSMCRCRSSWRERWWWWWSCLTPPNLVDTSSHIGDVSSIFGYNVAVDEIRWLDKREERAWRALQFMHLRLDGELARQLASDSALSYADYVVLVALTDRPDGRMRVFEIAETLGWEKSRVSHQVSRMAERGLVAKKKCGSDRRGAYVVVTRRGRRELEAAAPGHLRAVRRLFIDRLTPDQLTSIAEVAEEVLRGFEDATAGPGSLG